MPITLRTADYMLRHTTPDAVRSAQRILATSENLAAFMPVGYYSSTGPDILLAAFVAEDAADYLREDDLAPAGSLSRATTTRWIRELARRGLIERHDGSIALTSVGYDAVSVLIQRVSAAQRRLDPPKD